MAWQSLQYSCSKSYLVGNQTECAIIRNGDAMWIVKPRIPSRVICKASGARASERSDGPGGHVDVPYAVGV